jgi:hypothetical protein
VHTSLVVAGSPSSQPVPLPAIGSLQAPVDGAQVPSSWHWSLAVQTTGFEPVQLPAWQVSLCVHASLSSQPVPLATVGSLQTPVAGSQLPTVWHWSLAVQTTGFEPVHTPAWQLSLCVHASLSSQPVPLLAAGSLQTPVPGLQLPTVWHWSLAVQTKGFEPVHTPAWQLSLCVHASLSSQPVPLATAGSLQTPVAGSQLPAV